MRWGFSVSVTQYWLLKEAYKMPLSSHCQTNNNMKIETINIINERVLGWDSLTFKTRSNYEDCINGMIDYVADKELEVEFNHQAFSTNETDCTDSISMFCSATFKSIIMDNCIAWKEGEIITINLLKRTPTNIGCSKVARNNN